MGDSSQVDPHDTELFGEDDEHPACDDPSSESASGGADPNLQASSDGEREALRAELSELVEQLQRSRAELVNYRRRTENQMRAQRDRVTIEVFRQVLPIFDDLSTALDNETKSQNPPSALSEGLKLILDKCDQLLKEFRIEPIGTVGHPFNPEWHEALLHEETSEVPGGEVMEELERGFSLGDQLIRAARVKVAKAPTEE